MKSEHDIYKELEVIRAMRASERGGWELYMVQQALIWVLGAGKAPSEVLRIFDKIGSMYCE